MSDERTTVVNAPDVEAALLAAGFVEKLPDGALKLTPAGSLALGMLVSTCELPDAVICAVADAARKEVGRIVANEIASAFLPTN